MDKAISILKNITILYVEDETDLRTVTSQMLKSFTKNQYIAENGQEGLELFKEHEDEIDLIITDINMPVLNGLDMIKEIKEINKEVPTIVTTAFSNKEYLLDAINIGIDKYVLKPIVVSKLLEMMTQSLLYHELKDLYIDALTKLPNRNRLKKDLDDTSESLMALIDIDNFSTINDLFGEKVGDKTLIELSKKIVDFFKDKKYNVYRVEADVFGVVKKASITEIDDFTKEIKKFLIKTEEDAILVDENEIDINLTIGIAHGEGNNAFKFSQRIKDYAREKFLKVMIYDESLNFQKSFENNTMWIKKLKDGFKDNLLKAYFQPIVNTKTKEIDKYEALIRYVSKDGKEYTPAYFLEIAKKTKLYPKIIKVILRDTFRLIKEKGKIVSLNISYEDIANKVTLNYIMDLLEENKDFASKLQFEILESEEITNFDEVDEFVQKIKTYGCSFGIDDFGSGYSNFDIVTRLKIDFVKIDGSLIKNVYASREIDIIVKTIAQFFREFGIKTIGEFVFDENIYKKMIESNIDFCQGYYFSKPLSFEEV